MRYSAVSQFFLLLTATLVLVAGAWAGDDLQAEANALLVSTQKTSVIPIGGAPMPFHEKVTFRLRGMTTGDADGTFVRDFASKEHWRWKFEMPGYLEMEVRDGSRIGERRSSDFEPVRLRQLRASLPPVVVGLDSSDVVKKISRSKLHGVDVRCIEYENIRGQNHVKGQLCVDPASSTLMRWRRDELDKEWFDFVPLGDRLYPKHVLVRENDREIIEAEVEFREAQDLTPETFQVPSDMTVRKACEHLIPPVRISGEPPQYPMRVFNGAPTGTVVVQVIIGTDGRVKADQVLETSGHDLDKAAEDAVKHWVYEPAKCDGEPIEHRMDVKVNFKK